MKEKFLLALMLMCMLCAEASGFSRSQHSRTIRRISLHRISRTDNPPLSTRLETKDKNIKLSSSSQPVSQSKSATPTPSPAASTNINSNTVKPISPAERDQGFLRRRNQVEEDFFREQANIIKTKLGKL